MEATREMMEATCGATGEPPTVIAEYIGPPRAPQMVEITTRVCSMPLVSTDLGARGVCKGHCKMAHSWKPWKPHDPLCSMVTDAQGMLLRLTVTDHPLLINAGETWTTHAGAMRAKVRLISGFYE